MNPEVIEQVRKAWDLTIRDGFGQTETTCQIGNPPGLPVKPGSMGRPLPGYPIVLLDAAGQPADEGEICIALARRPVALTEGYFGDDEKTADAMRDGHYHTGDVASRDADGYITYVGRADDVFKSSDYRLSPFELESVLIEHPDVAEAAVVPSPDARRLNVPKAFVVLRAGVEPGPQTALSILRFARAQLARTSASGVSNSRNCRRPSPERSSATCCVRWESEQVSAQTRPAHSYREEDCPELAG